MNNLVKNIDCSIIMPIYNGEQTIIETLKSLLNQNVLFKELIIINDNSNDNSIYFINNYLREKNIEYKIINHSKNKGLAASYNDGIKKSKNNLVVILHQDVLLKQNALEKLLEPFSKDTEIVATFHVVDHPYDIWEKYNFWQKVYFSRLVGRKCYGLDGKFDCFRKDALIKVGLFDEFSFRSAGEDGDIIYKLNKIGKIIKTEATIIHLHKVDQKFNYKDIIYKQRQYSEAQGVLLRKGRINSCIGFVKAFFREMMLIMLFIPFINLLALFFILFYSFFYTKIIYIKLFKDPRCIILPFFNILLLFISFFYSCKGFISGKQKI